MADLIPTDGPLTMSSLEISELVEKRHDNVKRTIETLVSRCIISQPQIEDDPYTDAQGKVRYVKVYLLDKRSSMIVVAQLSPEFTARLVDRWQELEDAVAKQVAAPQMPQNPVLAGLSTLALELDRTQTQVADLDDRIAKLETDTNVVAFPAPPERISRRPGPKLRDQWLMDCKRHGITGRQFCDAHGYARSTVTEALTGKTNGPVSRTIRREIIATLISRNKIA